MKQSVNVYGYPVGGEQLSITQGVVSRIEYRTIAYDSSAVRIQIDAALNPGNSGGPAVSDGKLIGLVFSKYSAGDNIGYLLAAEEVKMLLKALEKGPYPGKLQLGEEVATTENEALRAKLGLEKEAGVLIVQPFSDKPDYPLKRWDVLLKIGDQPLDSQGNVKVLDELRLNYQYLVPKLARDGHVKLTVFRDRKTIEVNAPVRAQVDLVMPPLLGKYPRYFIYGPMVFTQATQDIAGRFAGSSLGAMYTTVLQEPARAALARSAVLRGRRDRGPHPLAPAQDLQRLLAAGLQHRQSRQRHEGPQPGAPGRVAAGRHGGIPRRRTGRPDRTAGLSPRGSAAGHRRDPGRRRDPQAVFRRSRRRLAQGK